MNFKQTYTNLVNPLPMQNNLKKPIPNSTLRVFARD